MKKFAHLLGAVLLGACLSTVAHADSITLTLTDPVQTLTGPQGAGLSTVGFHGTVTAPATNTGTYYILAIDQNGQRYKLITTSLFNSLSAGLTPGQSVTGELFDLTIPDGGDVFSRVPDGGVIPYPSTFLLEGGSDPLHYTDLYPSYSVGVNYIVGPAVAPEPPAWVLAAIGLVLLALVRGRVWGVWQDGTSVARCGLSGLPNG